MMEEEAGGEKGESKTMTARRRFRDFRPHRSPSRNHHHLTVRKKLAAPDLAFSNHP